MSSFETQRRLTVVNACTNVVDFTGGREALAARAPSPPHALVQPPGLLSDTGPWPPSSWLPQPGPAELPYCPRDLPARAARACQQRRQQQGLCLRGDFGAAEEGEQQAQGGPYLRDRLTPRDVFKAFVKCSQVCRGKSLFPIPFQWSGSVFMLMAVAAGIPELLWRDCLLHFHAGKEEFY